MRYTTFILGIILAAALLVAGCGNKQEGGNAPAKQEIKQGGQLVYGSMQEPNTLNPLLSDLLSTAEVGSLIFSGLVVTDEKGAWQPDLAAEVPSLQNGGISRDGLTITYRLRQGVTWHDGRPFTAEDVRFTWQVIMNRKVNIVNREGYEKIASITTPDPSTVVVRFKEYYAPALRLFTVILPKHALETSADINKAQFNRAPIGTGPFKFKEWRLAEEIILEANPQYFRGKPKLDAIVYRVIPDASIMLSQLKAGSLDMVGNIAFTQLDQVKGLGNIKIVNTPTMVWEQLTFNHDLALFQDAHVRKAIAMAIDRQAIIDQVLKGTGSPAIADQSPLSWAYHPSLQAPNRDVAGAKALLTEAGWKPGAGNIMTKEGRKLSFVVTVPSGLKPRELVVAALAQQLKEAGIEMEVRMQDAPVFFNDTLKTRHFEAALFGWVTDTEPDNHNLWHSKRIPTVTNGMDGQNYAGWRNPQVDALTDQIANTVDLEARKQLYYQLQEIITQEYPVVPLYFRNTVTAIKPNVLNYVPNPTMNGNLWRSWEWGFSAK